MALLRAKITIPRDTGLPEDVVTNTLHFSCTEGAPYTTARNDITAALQACYAAFDQILCSVLTAPGTITYYDMGEPTPRVPLGTATLPLTLDTTTVGLFPEEVAVVMSYRAASVSGENRARRRGRVYIGPVAPLSTLTAGRVRVSTSIYTPVIAGFQGLYVASQASATWSWVIYSPTYAAENASFEDRYAVVTNGYVDDAFDTQRRRGTAPTIRYTAFGT